MLSNGDADSSLDIAGRSRPRCYMRNLKITLAYDGTDFFGWQIQPEKPTIQGALSDAIFRVTEERVLPQGSGRTDAGVHAQAQVASCEINSTIPEKNFVIALNDVLPAAIRVLTAFTGDFSRYLSPKTPLPRLGLEFRIGAARGEVFPQIFGGRFSRRSLPARWPG